MLTDIQFGSRDSAFAVSESSIEDLAVLRHLLDLALQPLDSFDGFSQVEQILLGALRYQLNGLCWALALSQATRTPAFTGYLAAAQQAAIQKMCDKRVWGYWAYQELIGHGRWNPDPIVHSNVMYSGYLGVMIGLYETLNDDSQFSRPGAVTLRWNARRTYSYDFERLAQAIQANMLEYSQTPQYPCEPHLIYPICNTYALNTLRVHDRLHGSEFTGDLVQRVQVSYHRDRWRTSSGRFLTGRTRGGRMFAAPSVGNDAWMSYWLHSAMPEIAEATWDRVLQQDIQIRDGVVTFPAAGLEQRIDVGNYSVRRGGGPTYAMVAKAATEMGAKDVAEAIKSTVQQRYPMIRSAHGAARHSGMSNLANFLTAMARFGGPGVMRRLLDGNLPTAWQRGPILTAATYPEVLVARAETDGTALDLVLRPGNGPTSTTLTVGRLVPGSMYDVTGATTAVVRADGDGYARIPIDLRSRLEVAVRPSTAPPSTPHS